ncbi:MAG: phospholipase D-like domain-containing protein [Chloroflexota bacterium]
MSQGHIGSAAFLQVRKLAGPLHRRRPSDTRDQNDDLPPLPAPWTDERWFRGGFAPRQRNTLTPLVEGEAYFEDLIRTLLTARERVTICGWCLTPLMSLRRRGAEKKSVVADVLRDVSAHADVRVLLWSGAPFLFEPTGRMTREVQRTLQQLAPRVRCELDTRAVFSHDHHQKAVTVDGRVAYVGGIDLSTFQGDRWDVPDHPLRFGPNWHDAQMRLEGEVVQDVEANFCQRWNAVTGEGLRPLPIDPAQPSGDTPAQIVRTVPAGFYPFAPQGEFGIYHALVAAIRKARHFVYLENQYIWSPEIVDALVDAIRQPRSQPFRIVLVLPAKAYTGRYDNDEHVRLLSKVDDGSHVFSAYALYAGGPAIGKTGYHYMPIYVHAKVSIVDDEWVSIGSANLNRRGLATDTEMNVHTIAPELARALRIRLWAEHLGMSEEDVARSDPCALVDGAWPEVAHRLKAAIDSGGPPPVGQACPYQPKQMPGSRLLDLVQRATLER